MIGPDQQDFHLPRLGRRPVPRGRSSAGEHPIVGGVAWTMNRSLVRRVSPAFTPMAVRFGRPSLGLAVTSVGLVDRFPPVVRGDAVTNKAVTPAGMVQLPRLGLIVAIARHAKRRTSMEAISLSQSDAPVLPTDRSIRLSLPWDWTRPFRSARTVPRELNPAGGWHHPEDPSSSPEGACDV